MIFDAHSDILTDITIKRINGEKDIFKKYHLNNFRKANISGSIFAIWTDPPYKNKPLERVNQIITSVKSELETSKEVNIVKKYSDIKKGIDEDKINIIIGFEGLSHIDYDLDVLEYYYHHVGARHASLTWNEQNNLATGCSGDPHNGLTHLGKNAIHKLESLGMIVDVSHLNEKSFWDVMSIATKPIIASHSNSKTICNTKRNLTDKQLIEISNTGGIIGINSFRDFVSCDPSMQNIDGLVNHIDYIVNLVGIDHISLGFDFTEYLNAKTLDSFASSESDNSIDGLNCTSNALNIVDALKDRGYRNHDIDLICHGNLYRIFKEVLSN